MTREPWFADPTPEMVNAAAGVLDPLAMSDEPYSLGCGGPWHYEAHSSHSVCRCGSGMFASHETLAKEKIADRHLAKTTARRVLAEAFRAAHSQAQADK